MIKNTGGKALLMMASVGALTAASHAQERESTTDALRDVVVVQGTKKADGEDLQSAPVAVTAFGEDQIDALFVRDIQSLSYTMPNVQLEDVGTIPGTANFSIRGVAVNSSIPSIDPAVALVYDGVPLAINTGVIFDTFDLEGVEVLRGPQGTLFGRNATGGAVVMTTSAPSDELTVKGKVSVETGLLWRGSGVVSGPLVEGKLSAKLGIMYEDDEGYFENDAPILDAIGAGALKEDNLGDRESLVIRPALKWTPTENVEWLVKYEHGEIEGSPNPGQNRGLNGDEFETSVNDFGTYDSEWSQFTNEINWDVAFGNGTITNITGYRDYESTTIGDIDSSPITVFHSYALTEHEQISNELRYSGTFGNVDLTTGIFYMEQDLLYIEDREIPSAPIPFIGGGEQDVETLGLFAQADIALNEAFTLILGGRYSEEEKSGKIERIFSSMDCTRTSCSNYDAELDVDLSKFTPRIGLRYQPNQDLQVYASYTEGVRAGGFNFRNTSPVAPFTPFTEEKAASYELGVKAQLADGRVRINSAVFTTELSDLQREVNRADPTAGVVQEIRNTADATIQGIETEVFASVTDNFVLTGMLGLTSGDYDKVIYDISGDGVVNDRDKELDLPRLAPQTYGLGAIYDQPLSNGAALVMRANWNHRSSTKYTDNNLGTLPAVDLIDASISYQPAGGAWKLSVYGKNLLDEISFGNDTQLPPNFPGGPASAIPGPGATFSPVNKGQIIGAEIQFNY